jgi:hypothetical protein
LKTNHLARLVAGDQGDQIGRIFAYWAIATLGNFSKITEVDQFFVLLFNRVVCML